MSQLLLITPRYHPFIGPRAHRWTSLAEHWAAQGHEVHVVCARRAHCPSETTLNGVRVHRTGFDSLKELGYFLSRARGGRGRVGVAPKRPGRLARFGIWLYESVWKNLYFPDDAMLWYFPARRKVLQLLENQKFDALVSVSLPFTAHLVGLAAKRRFPDLRWLADIGDPFTIQAKPLNNARIYGAASRRLEAAILRAADVSAVTTAFTQKKYAALFGPDASARLIVIPPLLHPPPKTPTLRSSISSALQIGYFGAFYAPVRTPNAFLDLLERTFQSRPGLQGRLQAHCYGEIFSEFLPILQGQPAVLLHGLRSREEARSAMQRMDILLNIGNTTDYQLPSKAVEYLAAGRPVVNLSYVDDDPFAAFFEKTPNILNLKVENDRVIEAGLQQWLAWLDHLPMLKTPRDLAPFLVGAIARQYAEALDF